MIEYLISLKEQRNTHFKRTERNISNLRFKFRESHKGLFSSTTKKEGEKLCPRTRQLVRSYFTELVLSDFGVGGPVLTRMVESEG